LKKRNSQSIRSVSLRLVGLIILLNSGCANSSNKSVKFETHFNWLIGTWKQETKQGTIYEKWETYEGSGLSGINYALTNGDTHIIETIRIFKRDSHIIYQPQVKNQNKGKPIKFICTFNSPAEVKFENKTHDFPQYIKYKMIHTDSIYAEIGGLMSDRIIQVPFGMKRVKKTR